jgi:hypothetical protein
MSDQNTENGNSNEKCPTRLLSDDPSDIDIFEGKGHQKIADAIADMIIDKDEIGGKTIGLEGNWGSGKSTVINF